MGQYKAIISLSGGLDSTALLSMVLGKDWVKPEEILAVNFHYGQTHANNESVAAVYVARHYKVNFRPILANEIFRGFDSNLLKSNDKAIPEGHYEAESMRATVVPGRNMIFLSILAGIAESEGAGCVYIGVHAGDHHIYPDCRPSFINSMRASIEAATDRKVSLYAPFLHEDKTRIVKTGMANNAPFHLTWTCYKGGEKACGKCGSCQERLEAFYKNNRTDPIDYESRELLPK